MEKEKRVLTGEHFIQGDIACAEGAISVGCNFFAGYPITPASEIAERMSERQPCLGGTFIQMEDEIASITAVLGASWAGAKAMTATSGPGIALMLENIGLGIMMESPCVIVNVQRGSPSTGLPTLWGQADMMQARWGTHGDYRIIALCPNSPQELYDLTIKGFNLSEKYRVPVFIMTDAVVGHMTEKVIIPKEEDIEIYPRRYTTLSPKEYLPYKPEADLVPQIIKAGDGYRIHTTGLTHDERGYPVMSAECQKKLVSRLIDKILNNLDDIIIVEEKDMDDAEVVVISYGITSRVVIPTIQKARENGIKVGSFRLITAWPFPGEKIRELSERVKGFVVPEINCGQMVREVERHSKCSDKVELVPHTGGDIHDPDTIYEAIMKVAKS
ncbi:2-oxoacid:acceptor oxidoreductase subunit alpha [bacterium]|nr:2-oxoacid:acceptor oxidoreductase subunit alpha [bacterium]